jgi:hypothetical protein
MVWTTVYYSPSQKFNLTIWLGSLRPFSGLSYPLYYSLISVQVGDYDVVLAGIPPFNASVAYENFGVSISIPYWFDELSYEFLWDPTIAIEFPPTTEQCRNAGDSCYSYIFPA